MLDSAPGILQSSVLITALSVRGCATPGTAANAPATPCTVSETCTPHFRQRRDVSGTPDLSIGRNYDAHAIEMVSQTPPARRLSFSRNRLARFRLWHREGRPIIPVQRSGKKSLQSRPGRCAVQGRAPCRQAAVRKSGTRPKGKHSSVVSRAGKNFRFRAHSENLLQAPSTPIF